MKCKTVRIHEYPKTFRMAISARLQPLAPMAPGREMTVREEGFSDNKRVTLETATHSTPQPQRSTLTKWHATRVYRAREIRKPYTAYVPNPSAVCRQARRRRVKQLLPPRASGPARQKICRPDCCADLALQIADGAAAIGQDKYTTMPHPRCQRSKGPHPFQQR